MGETMNRCYEAFVGDPEIIPEGVEIRLFIRDLTPGPRKYDRRFVKAVVSTSTGVFPGEDSLRLRYLDGKPYPKTLALEVLQDFCDSLTGQPYTFHTGLFPEE